MNQNLVIKKEQLSHLLGVTESEAAEVIQNVKYVTMMAMSDGDSLVVFIPEPDSPAVTQAAEIRKDLEKNAPTIEKLRELGLVCDD